MRVEARAASQRTMSSRRVSASSRRRSYSLRPPHTPPVLAAAQRPGEALRDDRAVVADPFGCPGSGRRRAGRPDRKEHLRIDAAARTAQLPRHRIVRDGATGADHARRARTRGRGRRCHSRTLECGRCDESQVRRGLERPAQAYPRHRMRNISRPATVACSTGTELRCGTVRSVASLAQSFTASIAARTVEGGAARCRLYCLPLPWVRHKPTGGATSPIG
jgi:hypothetical protein